LIERAQWYTTKFVNAGLVDGYSQFNLGLQTDSDAPFRLYGIAFYVFDNTGTPQAAAENINVSVQFTLPNGTNYYQRHVIPAQALQPFDQQAPNGAGGQSASFYSYFSPVNPNQLYPPRTAVEFNFTDAASIATSTVVAVLVGTKIFPDGAVWSPQYPKNYRALPFDYAIQIPVSTLPILNQPFTINPDADFVWQKGAQTDYGGGTAAALGVNVLGEIFYFVLTATNVGAAGNAITFAVTGVGTPNLPLTISVIGNAISVQVATDGSGNSITTLQQIANLISATPAAAALATVTFLPVPSTIFLVNYPATHLSGGTGGGSTGQAKGLGVKFRDPALKEYMNDYVPIELLFGFDNSQNPGLVYPEIYIPSQNQMQFDVAGLIAGLSYPSTLTLTFKGMKVYGR
jgi:hypothetical protein